MHTFQFSRVGHTRQNGHFRKNVQAGKQNFWEMAISHMFAPITSRRPPDMSQNRPTGPSSMGASKPRIHGWMTRSDVEVSVAPAMTGCAVRKSKPQARASLPIWSLLPDHHPPRAQRLEFRDAIFPPILESSSFARPSYLSACPVLWWI